MKAQQKKNVSWFAGLVFLALLSACSSQPKPSKTPQSPVPEAPADAQKSRETKPPADNPALATTVIPPEEKKAATEGAAFQEKMASEKDASSNVLEEALNSYQEARLAREKGDLDAALQALDKAYENLLKVQVPPDSTLLQEKNDLRLLIAQRIQEIYASRRSPVAGLQNSIPLVEHKRVKDEIESFRTVEKAVFEEAYKRSGLYREMICEELRKAGLPDELSWLPIIESGFMVKALSRARALGLWQFIASTGYLYGLTRDRWVDERMDPLKSTRAAIKLLNDLHSLFGDWTTALAAYNCGAYYVQNVINSQHINYLDNFWDLFERLPWETARFVPRFIAAALIIQNPEKYGFKLPTPYSPLKYEVVNIQHPLKLASLSAALGLESSVLTYLNPELRYESTPNSEYSLKIPIGYAEKTLQAINNLPQYIPPESTFSWHVVRSGDSLWQIARRYRTTVQAIIRLNDMRPPYLILPGRQLKIPGR